MSQTPDIVKSLRFQLRDWNGKNRFAFSKVNALTISEAADTIEALTAELDQAVFFVEEHKSTITDLQNTLIRLTRELGEARDALDEYANHKPECQMTVEFWIDDARCDCGYSDAIARHEHRKD